MCIYICHIFKCIRFVQYDALLVVRKPALSLFIILNLACMSLCLLSSQLCFIFTNVYYLASMSLCLWCTYPIF